jgi:hypothetical protein
MAVCGDVAECLRRERDRLECVDLGDEALVDHAG